MTSILTLLLCSNAGAMPSDDTALAAARWSRVAQVGRGESLRVRTVGGVTERGRFHSADADTIRLSSDSGEIAIARQDVAKVEVHAPSRRLRNILLGTGIGAAAGIAGAFATCPSCVGELSASDFQTRLAIGGLVGAGLGAGIGALGSGYRTVYRRR